MRHPAHDTKPTPVSENDAPRPIVRVAEREVFANRFGTLFNDDVTTPDGRPGRYLRWRWAGGGVVVVPRRGDEVALASMFRYPIGDVSLELPRGGVAPGERLEDAAVRELREEVGLTASRVHPLGTLFADTGLIETPISVVLVEVNDDDDAPRAEPMESIAPTARWMTRAALREALSQGRLRCAISIAALARAEAL